ncbi:hypothetical protein Tco_0657714 [Tanacetum coccineum]
MYRPSFDSPSPSSRPKQGYSSLNRINLDMDIENLFNTQDYYAGQGSGGNQDFYTSQDYSMGHGSAFVEDDSSIKEVAPIKAEKVLKRRHKSVTTENKESSKPWTTEEEVVLCSTHGGLNLNEEADGYEEEVRKVQPMGRDRAKKKASSSSRSKSSYVAGGGLVDLVTDKWKSITSASWGKKETTRVLYTVKELGIGYTGNGESRGSRVEKRGT